ncbi:MAG: membrane protein insertase YidC, partial [Planctomycetota bacterium]
MDDQNKNLILATALSFLVILVWFLVFPPPEATNPQPQSLETSSVTDDQGDIALAPSNSDPAASTDTTSTAPEPEEDDAPRIAIDTPTLEGTISLNGGRIDELRLKGYRETLDEGSPIVTLLSPVGTTDPYYALFGWAPGSGLTPDQVPGANTRWEV